MNLEKPELLRRLAREHALGTLTGGARRRFELLLTSSLAARAELARWQEVFASLAASLPPLTPRAQVWVSLQQRLGFVPLPSRVQPPAWQRLFGRRTGSGRRAGSVAGVTAGLVFGVLAGVVTTSVLLQANPAWVGNEQVRDSLPASYVGLLSDAAGKPSVLLSSRRHGRVLSAKMLQALPAPAGTVAYLWAFPKDGGAPFLVGRTPEKGSGSLTLPDSSEKLFFKVERLGISFEPVNPATSGPGGNVAPAAPSTPMVVSGPCVKLW